MTEETFQIIQNILGYVQITFYGICLAWFLSKTYCAKQNRKLSSIVVFLSYMGFYVLRITIFDVPGWISCIVVLVILMLFLRKKEKPRIKFLIFLIITWYCVLNICMLIELSLYQIVTNMLFAKFESMEIFLTQLMVLYGIGSVLKVYLFFGMMIMLEKRIRMCSDDMQEREMRYLLLMPVAGVLFGNIIRKVLLVVKDEIYFDMYEEFPTLLVIVPAVSILFYFGILFSISGYSSMVALQKEKKKNFVEEQKVQALKNRMEEVEQFYDVARRMKHDMRNHVSAIKGLIAKGDFDEVDTYINAMDQSMGGFDFSIKTGNAVTDVIINDFRKKSQKAGVDFNADFIFEEELRIEAFDIGIVISNLLENALEACISEKVIDEKGKIQITGRKKKRFYLIEVKNSFHGQLVWEEKTGFPKSTKTENQSLHGIGLENVSKVAEKYLGSMNIKVLDDVFCVTVMLQEREEAV